MMTSDNFGHLLELGARFAAQFLGQCLRGGSVHVIHRSHCVTLLLDATRHVAAHAPDSDKSNFFWHKLFRFERFVLVEIILLP